MPQTPPRRPRPVKEKGACSRRRGWKSRSVVMCGDGQDKAGGRPPGRGRSVPLASDRLPFVACREFHRPADSVRPLESLGVTSPRDLAHRTATVGVPPCRRALPARVPWVEGGAWRVPAGSFQAPGMRRFLRWRVPPRAGGCRHAFRATKNGPACGAPGRAGTGLAVRGGAVKTPPNFGGISRPSRAHRRRRSATHWASRRRRCRRWCRAPPGRRSPRRDRRTGPAIRQPRGRGGGRRT